MVARKNVSLLLFMSFILVAGPASYFSWSQRDEHDDIKERRGRIRSLAKNVANPGDLNMRFNKISFGNGEVPDFMPLKASDYPISGDIATKLKHDSNAVSIVCDYDPALASNHQALLQSYVKAIGGGPSMPSSNMNDPFWGELREVVRLQIGRRNNMDPRTVLHPPDLWAGRDIHQVAEAVHDEYPGYHQVELIKWLWGQGSQLDHNIIPFRSQKDFVGLQIALADLNTWAIGEVGPMNFYAKWAFGRPRPEEVAFLIARHGLTYEDDCVPPDIIDSIKSMLLRSPEEFTAYPEGAPRHPAWPAMHSAASSASFWLAVVMDLTDEQYCEALRVDYAVAFARSCAGVHYPSDNTAGLNLGQAIIADKLPDHLAEKYGSDPANVRAKIERLRFNWENFDSFSCSLNA